MFLKAPSFILSKSSKRLVVARQTCPSFTFNAPKVFKTCKFSQHSWGMIIFNMILQIGVNTELYFEEFWKGICCSEFQFRDPESGPRCHLWILIVSSLFGKVCKCKCDQRWILDTDQWSKKNIEYWRCFWSTRVFRSPRGITEPISPA